jgi:hypothetical protein
LADLQAGPVAVFWLELHRLVEQCDLQQTEIAAALGLKSNSVSDMFRGRRKKVPDWDVVQTIIDLCAARSGQAHKTSGGLSLDRRWWKTRHAELERTAATERSRGTRTATPAAVPSAPKAHTADCLGMTVEEAVRLLASGRAEPSKAVEQLLVSPGLAPQSHGLPAALDTLLKQVPARVRAARGVGRLTLIQAARVVLAAVSVMQFADRAEAPRLVTDLTDARKATYRAALADVHDHVLADHASQLDTTYRELASPLAQACPEFALAAGVPGPAVERWATRQGKVGLSALGRMLAEFAGSDDIAPRHAIELREPIATLDPSGPRLPTLADGYVNPRFRLAEGSTPERDKMVASDKWWALQPVQDDIEHYLASFLLSLPALLAPLVVLGDPGVGKSLLTKLLAGRFPIREFRPLRIELRRTPAQDDLHRQLEDALHELTGRPQNWADWYSTDPEAIPVVLLDGFDELLQAGAQKLDSTRLWGYLQEIKSFQKREASLDRPLIVIVTSRTVVADRAEIPEDSPVLCIAPFANPETTCWLDIWNTTNAGYFKRRSLRPLTSDAVLVHKDLAAQPLLLLMLALYDAADNALHRLRDDGLRRTELYDRLLTEFTRRQVDKDGPLPPPAGKAAAESELNWLSAIAIAMFHRGSQTIGGEDAARDLHALGVTAPGDTRDPQLFFGRFFFVHEARALVADESLRSYEFMHATFGEHLTARRIDQALRRLVTSTTTDDAELYTLLAFVPLTDRAQVVANLGDMFATWPKSLRHELPTALGRLFRDARWDPPRSASTYTPVHLTRAHRDTVYEANLLLIGVLSSDDHGIYGSHYLHAAAPMNSWRRCAQLWQSQLSEESWQQLSSTLNVEHCLRPAVDASSPTPDLWISTRQTSVKDHHLGLRDSPTEPRPLTQAAPRRRSSAEDLVVRIQFAGDQDADLLLHAAHPLLQQVPAALKTYYTDRDNRVRSTAQALIALVTRKAEDRTIVPELYDRVLRAIEAMGSKESASLCLDIVMRQLVHDVPDLSDKELASVLSRLTGRLTGPLRLTTKVALFECLDRAVGRQDPELIKTLTTLHEMLSNERDRRSLLLLAQAGLSSSAWERFAMPYAQTADTLLDDVLSDLSLTRTASHHPALLVTVLRIAADLGLHNWLTANAPRILQALSPTALYLLRPTDLPHLREALPPGEYAAEFEEIERIWRG